MEIFRLQSQISPQVATQMNNHGQTSRGVGLPLDNATSTYLPHKVDEKILPPI
ncbi:Protein of unknown function [Pyronema omphalodes CBS 100304]|uniref:Uncharacterized protein n=1 Tax=Pyronema omphalodes (strain CBS 100304) TaxID=1076935 RepID=U4L3C8_PYROM|nr:Protein of unknown function [Pyronema omphalodes CBS 100304]